MVETGLNKYHIGFYDVNDNGYITKLVIDINAYTEESALNIAYKMDEEDQIDYTKAKVTKRKYNGNEEDEFEDFQTFIVLGSESLYPAHKANKSISYTDAISLNLPNFVESLDSDELEYLEDLIKERHLSETL